MVIILDKLEYEHTANGGSSLLDKVNKIHHLLQFSLQKVRIFNDLSHPDKGIFDATTEGIIIWTSSYFRHLTGLASEECLGHGWKNSIYSQDKKFVIEEWELAIRQQRNTVIEYRCVNTSGVLTNVRLETKIVRNDDGVMIGIVGIITKIGTTA